MLLLYADSLTIDPKPENLYHSPIWQLTTNYQTN